MRFEIFQPCAALCREVEYFIVSESESVEPYTVLPDTAVVMGFQYSGTLSVLAGDREQRLAPAGVTGLQKGYKLFKNNEPAGTILVRFRPGGAVAFFQAPMHELFSESLALDELLNHSAINVVEEQLQMARTDAERIGIVERFLLSCKREVEADELVEGAVRIIHESGGAIRIGDLVESLYTSASPLEKRFRSRIGASPKRYADIVRFRAIIHAGKGAGSPAARAYEAGYYDQAHFIKDFKRFTGTTPEVFFQKPD